MTFKNWINLLHAEYESYIFPVSFIRMIKLTWDVAFEAGKQSQK